MIINLEGIDLNPVFTDAVSFRPSGSNPGDGVGELDLFRKAGIELVHGWLVDPESEESEVVSRYGDYDRAVELVAEVDHLTGGRLVLEDQEAGVSDEAGGSGGGSGGSGAGGNLSEAQRKKVEDGESFWPIALIKMLMVFFSHRRPEIPRQYFFSIDLSRSLLPRPNTQTLYSLCFIPKLASIRNLQNGRTERRR